MIQAVAPFYEEVNVLELEPEILPDISGRPSISGLFLPRTFIGSLYFV